MPRSIVVLLQNRILYKSYDVACPLPAHIGSCCLITLTLAVLKAFVSLLNNLKHVDSCDKF